MKIFNEIIDEERKTIHELKNSIKEHKSNLTADQKLSLIKGLPSTQNPAINNEAKTKWNECLQSLKQIREQMNEIKKQQVKPNNENEEALKSIQLQQLKIQLKTSTIEHKKWKKRCQLECKKLNQILENLENIQNQIKIEKQQNRDPPFEEQINYPDLNEINETLDIAEIQQNQSCKYTLYLSKLSTTTLQKDKRILYLEEELKKVEEEKLVKVQKQTELLKNWSIEQLREKDQRMEDEISDLQNEIQKINKIEREQCNSEALGMRKERKVQRKALYLENRENKKISFMKNAIKKIYELFAMTKNEQAKDKLIQLLETENLDISFLS